MRTILITGATTGIGAAIALTIARAGDTVFLHYHANRDRCEAVAETLRQRECTAVLIQADFSSDPDGAARAVTDRIRAVSDTLHVLVNNAGGIVGRTPLEEAEFGDVAATLNLNLVAPMMVTAYLMPLLRRAGDEGRADVVNITSIAARSGAPTVIPYGAAKAGLENATRGLAKEVGPAVRVNAVSPGVIQTPFHEGKTPADRMEAWREATPVGHHGRPEDIAEAVVFVLTNDFMTGAVVPVNGGMQMI